MGTGAVYFAEAMGAGAVKIGYCVGGGYQRIKCMQASNHCELWLAAFVPGPFRLEAEMHERFKEFRIRGEWFRLEGKLKAFVLANKVKPVILPEAVRVRCPKCKWEGNWKRLDQRCPKCSYWSPREWWFGRKKDGPNSRFMAQRKRELKARG